jgi:hypothetical protein
MPVSDKIARGSSAIQPGTAIGSKEDSTDHGVQQEDARRAVRFYIWPEWITSERSRLGNVHKPNASFLKNSHRLPPNKAPRTI